MVLRLYGFARKLCHDILFQTIADVDMHTLSLIDARFTIEKSREAKKPSPDTVLPIQENHVPSLTGVPLAGRTEYLKNTDLTFLPSPESRLRGERSI